MAMAPSPCPRHVSLELTHKALPASAARLARSASIARTARLDHATSRPSTFTGWTTRAPVRTAPALRVTRSRSSGGGRIQRGLNDKRLVAARSTRLARDARADRGSAELPSDLADLGVQHPPVYTLGTRSDRTNLRFDPTADALPGGADLFVTERGGEVTYHGPGQLVIYPIVDLRQHHCDLHWYLRSLEEVIIRGLEEGFGIRAGRESGMTGVWAAGSKLAAMGVRVSRWITFHGAALNVTTDLSAFAHIIPCGLTLPVGSVASHLHHHSHAAHATAAAAAAAVAAAGGYAADAAVDRAVVDGAAVEGAAVASIDTWQAEMGDGPDSRQEWEESMMTHAAQHVASAFAEVFNVDMILLHQCLATTAKIQGFSSGS
ncbi:unnamed protein product [Closterium sp. Yama58-4]|nr:unnamed protein product [Closterium sp. Yama58-4]